MHLASTNTTLGEIGEPAVELLINRVEDGGLIARRGAVDAQTMLNEFA